ncbi:Txe/YoeB family addiction module toxin [Flavobacterium zepuense]|uniref:Putative mRNA interferase YoeB n=1 Tax=Flavobacterium zepuense TaxID=2593302 RepID=A0A552V7X6_9FLAO|nr:Txe/YoeB family addiction module toxin [Flavobacterium zepuense]TRW26566.1 Txe/YoeB family addiction module toxin [Flavobacterium zepuense]
MSFSIEFTETALEDYNFWKKTNNIQVLNKIKSLLANMKDTPFTGIGQPEALRHELNGYYSRRINKEHRIVYTVDNTIIYVVQLRGHY